MKQRLKEQYKESMNKYWFFEKINKIDKSLAKLIKRKKKTQIIKLEKKTGNVTTDTNEIQMITGIF
jgi:hypothetical protein